MNEQEDRLFEEMVVKELDACGYFLFSKNGEKVDKDKLIMDFACLYCMEHYNKNYRYKLVEDEQDSKVHYAHDVEKGIECCEGDDWKR